MAKGGGAPMGNKNAAGGRGGKKGASGAVKKAGPFKGDRFKAMTFHEPTKSWFQKKPHSNTITHMAITKSGTVVARVKSTRGVTFMHNVSKGDPTYKATRTMAKYYTRHKRIVK